MLAPSAEKIEGAAPFWLAAVVFVCKLFFWPRGGVCYVVPTDIPTIGLGFSVACVGVLEKEHSASCTEICTVPGRSQLIRIFYFSPSKASVRLSTQDQYLSWEIGRRLCC